jgi:hypothetical protein
MNNQEELNWKQAAAIGFLGGVCLVLLKLVQARFYIDDPWSKEAVVAYLTYAVFLLFGAVAGVFFPVNNVRRNTLIAGLLAPSIILTFFSAPNFRFESVGEPPKEIKTLSLNIVTTAHAQQAASSGEQQTKEAWPAVAFRSIRKSDVEPTFKDALLQALGRPQPVNSYLFVIGKTPDKEKATATATFINHFFNATKTEETAKLPAAQVIKIEGVEDYLVALGSLQKSTAVLATKKLAYSAAVTSLTKWSDVQTTRTAPLLLEAKVVDAREFFQ